MTKKHTKMVADALVLHAAQRLDRAFELSSRAGLAAFATTGLLVVGLGFALLHLADSEPTLIVQTAEHSATWQAFLGGDAAATVDVAAVKAASEAVHAAASAHGYAHTLDVLAGLILVAVAAMFWWHDRQNSASEGFQIRRIRRG